jgi:hypothetical protein
VLTFIWLAFLILSAFLQPLLSTWTHPFLFYF